MHGEGSTPEGARSDFPAMGLEPDAVVTPVDMPGAGLVRLSMLTVDSEPASLAPDASEGIGRIAHPQGRPVFVELPTDPLAFSAEALQALADIADSLSQNSASPQQSGQKKAGHDGPAKSNREVKKMSAKHHRLREPR